MNLINVDRVNNLDIRLLNDAFITFNEATQRLQEYYGNLEERVKELNLELKRKNRELEKSLQEKEEVKNYLKNILESLSTGVIAVNFEGKVTTFNKAARKITNLSLKGVKSKDFDTVFSPVFSEEFINFEFLKSLKEDFEMETIIGVKDKSPLQIRLSSSPVKSARGKVIGFMLLLHDISKVKKLEEQIQRTNRLAAMGEIAVTIAHEIRNPLGTIELFASLLRKDLADDEKGRRLADHISCGVKSLDQIVSNLLLFTKRQQLIFREMDVHKYLDDSLLFASHIMKQNNIEVVKEYGLETPVIHADVELLKQVFLNIVFNAVQSMSKGGTLTISTRMTSEWAGSGTWGSDAGNALIGPRNRQFVQISFADTGVGISEDDKGKLFSPFFTTKERGTGLGLAIVHNIVESHKGMVDVESVLDSGSVFTISLPLSSDCKAQEFPKTNDPVTSLVQLV